MDIKNLEQILKSNKIPMINRLSGRNFSVYECPKKIKKHLIKLECKDKNLKLCESDNDQILAIFEDKYVINEEQLELINLLYKYDVIAIPI